MQCCFLTNTKASFSSSGKMLLDSSSGILAGLESILDIQWFMLQSVSVCFAAEDAWPASTNKLL